FIVPAIAPALQAAAQVGRGAAQFQPAAAAVAVGIADQGRGGLVGQGDPVGPVHHQHAGAHAADDQLVDFEQVGDLVAALVGQLLVAACAVADLVTDVGQGQVTGDEHGQLGQGPGGVTAFEQLPQVLAGGGGAG